MLNWARNKRHNNAMWFGGGVPLLLLAERFSSQWTLYFNGYNVKACLVVIKHEWLWNIEANIGKYLAFYECSIIITFTPSAPSWHWLKITQKGSFYNIEEMIKNICTCASVFPLYRLQSIQGLIWKSSGSRKKYYESSFSNVFSIKNIKRI